MQRVRLAPGVSLVALVGLSLTLAAGCLDREGIGNPDGGSAGTGHAGTGHAGTGGTGAAGTGSATGTAGTGTATGTAGTGPGTGTAGTGSATGTAGTGPGTGAAGTGPGTGTAGTGALMCPPVCTIFCEYGNVVDAKGCATCKCNPAPVCKPSDCTTTSAGVSPTPLPPACGGPYTPPVCARDASTGKCALIPGKCDMCPAIGCANKCQYGQKIAPSGCPTCECNPPPAACAKDECGALPPLDFGKCADGSVVPQPVCERNTGGMCGWSFSKCPPPMCPALLCQRACPNGTRPDANGCGTCDCIEPETCASHGDWKTCGVDMRCTWLQPGCGSPALATPGCFARTDVGCQSDGACSGGRSCLKRVVNPCFNPGGGASCDACGVTQTVCL